MFTVPPASTIVTPSATEVKALRPKISPVTVVSPLVQVTIVPGDGSSGL